MGAERTRHRMDQGDGSIAKRQSRMQLPQKHGRSGWNIVAVQSSFDEVAANQANGRKRKNVRRWCGKTGLERFNRMGQGVHSRTGGKCGRNAEREPGIENGNLGNEKGTID